MNVKSQLEKNVAKVGQPRTDTPPALPQREGSGRRKDVSLFYLAVDRLRADEGQVRKENKSDFDEEIQQLSDSIKDVGVLEPLNVRYITDGDFYQVVAGERRFTAAKLAGLTEVPVKLLDVDETQVRKIQLIENIHRADLTALELSEALQSLMQDGSTVDDLAKLLKKSKPYVQKALGIARNLTEKAKEAGADLPMAHLYEISQLPEAEQVGVVNLVKEDNVTADELRRVVADRKPKGGAGRPAAVKAFRKVVNCPNEVSITFASKNASQTILELLEALAQARKILQKEQKEEENPAAE